YRAVAGTYNCTTHVCQRIAKCEYQGVIAICSPATAINSVAICKINIEGAGATVNFPRQHCIQLYKRQPIMLRKRLTCVVVVGVADGPAVQRRHACYAIEYITLPPLCRASVGGADGGPRAPVPARDQVLMS